MADFSISVPADFQETIRAKIQRSALILNGIGGEPTLVKVYAGDWGDSGIMLAAEEPFQVPLEIKARKPDDSEGAEETFRIANTFSFVDPTGKFPEIYCAVFDKVLEANNV